MRVDHKYTQQARNAYTYMYVHAASYIKTTKATCPHIEPKLARRKEDNERGPVAALGLHPVVSRELTSCGLTHLDSTPDHPRPQQQGRP